jgi:hypothetical protein
MVPLDILRQYEPQTGDLKDTHPNMALFIKSNTNSQLIGIASPGFTVQLDYNLYDKKLITQN